MIIGNTPSALAAKAAPTTVPIVFVWATRSGMASSPTSTGPVATSLVPASCQWILRRSSLGSCVSCGREPRALACSSIPKWPLTEPFVSQVRAAASTMGQQIDVLYVSSDREIETAFTTLPG